MARDGRWALAAGGAVVGLFGGAALVASAQMEGPALTRFSPGEVIRSADVNANFAALAEAVADLRAERAPPDRLDVAPQPAAGQYASLDAALAALDRVRLGADQSVAIRLAPGEYAHERPVEIRHPDGDRIRIVGPGATLRFTTPGDGIQVTDGRRLGLLDGVRIVGAGDGVGVSVKNGAFVRLGDVAIAGFARGVDARTGAIVVVETGLTIEQVTDYGVVAERNATVNMVADALEVTGAATGILASDAGLVHAAGARLTGCVIGANALFGGRVSVGGAVVHDADAVGLTAGYGGSLFAEDAEVRDVTRFQCLYAAPGGRIDASRSTVSGCGGQGALAQGGAIVLSNGEVSDTAGVGVEAFGGATIFADGVTTRRTWGFLALRQSYLSAAGARSLEGRADAFRAGDVSVVAADGAEAAHNVGIGFAAFRGGVLHAARSVVEDNRLCHFTGSSYGQVYAGGANVQGCVNCCVQNCEVGSTVCTAP